MADPWLDPLLVVNRSLRFEHGPEDVQAARDFVGPVEAADASSLARGIVTHVHERMRIRPSAFRFGMPKSLAGIVAAGGGNCVAHSVLSAVLLRDRGMPARLISEDVYTNLSTLRLPAALIPARIGPVLNGHVWLEVSVNGEWVPADAELGVIGVEEWLVARLARGATLAAMGLPVREHWKFPLRIRRLGPDGQPAEDVTALYLIDRLGAVVSAGTALPRAWLDGVQYFSRSFRWDGWPGLRILGEWGRLRAMTGALAGISGALESEKEPIHERRA